jgi:hypothetical protein
MAGLPKAVMSSTGFAGRCSSASRLKASVAIRSSFSKSTCRPWTDLRIHPPRSWPTFRWTMSFVASSRNTATSVPSPMIVPSRESDGSAGSTRRGGGKGAAMTGGTARSGGGGRREGENNGRSTVIRRSASGTPHKGFPVFGPAPSPAYATLSAANTSAAIRKYASCVTALLHRRAAPFDFQLRHAFIAETPGILKHS